MKTRYFSLLAAMLITAFNYVSAQDIQEKTPVNLSGVWQMCFYRSSSPNIAGELKTSNSLKILSEDGRFTNIVMMQTGAIIIGCGTYQQINNNTYAENIEKNIHLPQLNGKTNKLQFEMKENGNLMYIKYFVENDINGNKIDSWNHEIWKRVEMPSEYPANIVR